MELCHGSFILRIGRMRSQCFKPCPSKALLVHIVHVKMLTPMRRKDALRPPEVFSPIWVETILADKWNS
jgi:hypothetical protein